jgi:thymidylate kinase
MKPFVAFEGPDGAGKSTLALKVAHRLATEVGPTIIQKLTYDSKEEEYLELLNSEYCVVQDRTYLSDEVYGPIFAGGPRFGIAFLADCDQAFHLREAKVVLVTAAPWILELRLKTETGSGLARARRNDSYIELDKLKKIHHSYEDMWNSDRIERGHRYDTSARFPSEDEVDQLTRWIID